MPDNYNDRFGDTDLDWIVIEDDEEPPTKQEKHTPGGHEHDQMSHGRDGGGGGDKEGSDKEGGDTGSGGGAKVTGLSDFAKDDVGIYYSIGESPDKAKVFVDTWNKHVGKTPAEFKKEYLGGGAIDGKMTLNLRPDYDGNGDVLVVHTRLENEDGDETGRMDSSFFPGEDRARVHMDYYSLDEQAHGVMKSVMAHEMAMWQDMGVKTVDLLANLDVGGYAWARYGFEPTKEAWRDLSSDLNSQIDSLSEGGGGGRADSWSGLTDDQQNRIERSFHEQTRDEFNDHEVENWRDSGQPVEDAKVKLADDFKSGDGDAVEWATSVVNNYIAEREKIGEPVPFQADDIVEAVQISFDVRTGFSIDFDDTKLSTPVGIDTSPTLPGIPEVAPHEYLTEEMRDDIAGLLERSFDVTAGKNADDAEPPDYLWDSAREAQGEYWDEMSDEDRFAWAERHDSSSIEGSSGEGTGEIPQEEADALMKLTNSDDPKSIWAIADSKWGKRLLLGMDWNGHLETDNPDHMARFNAYVGKAKK